MILCATRELEREMAEFLDCLGYRYPDDSMLSQKEHWSEFRESFCYFVNNRYVRRGSKELAECSPYRRYTKCSFQGLNVSNFDIASRQELLSLLGM